MANYSVILVGDSVLDNQIWTALEDGVKKFEDNLSYQEPAVAGQIKKRFEQSGDTVLVHNFAIDGARTDEVLNGIKPEKIYKRPSKDIPLGKEHAFSQKKINVLDEIQTIHDATEIILSVGGNDVREQLPNIHSMKDIEKLLEKTQTDYISILERLKREHKNARISIVLLYLLDSRPGQDHYGIYKKMSSLNPQQDPKSTLKLLLTRIYVPILKKAQELGISAIDLTSTFDSNEDNYIRQIEPNKKASTKIAQLIHQVAKSEAQPQPLIYSCPYINNPNGEYVAQENFNSWQPEPDFSKIKNKIGFTKIEALDLDELQTMENQGFVNFIETLHKKEASFSQLGQLKQEIENGKLDPIKTKLFFNLSLINDILEDLKSKTQQIDYHLLEAKGTAEKLITDLTAANKKYQEDLSDPKISLAVAGERFKKESTRLIKDALPILERDVGWGIYLWNLCKKIASIICTFGMNSHLFPRTISTSESVAKEVEVQLGGIKIQ